MTQATASTVVENDPALASLLKNAARFEFTQAISVIQGATPGAVAIGGIGPPDQEAVRLRPTLEVSFAASDLGPMHLLPPTVDGAPGPRFVLECRFLGLYGQASPLPSYFTENLIAQENAAVQRGFIDIFNHRLLSLAYRVMTKYRLTESPKLRDRMLALLGMPGEPSAGDSIDRSALLACAGLLSQQPRSAAAMERVLAYWLECPVVVEQCVAQWIDLPRDRQTQLGEQFRLGVDSVCGEAMFNCSTSFRVQVGPVDGPLYESLLPGGPNSVALHELVAEFNAECLDYQVEVLIPAGELPSPRLNGASRLGWDTCMVGDPTAILRIRFTHAPP
jgi:type VI secretion system protein ImpH